MPVDALVVDTKLPAGTPGVHALIVGVSDYQFLPALDDIPREETWFLTKLSSPALSAFKVYQRLRQDDLRLPLKTVRLLLSPSQRELQAEPALAQITMPSPAATTAPRADRFAFERAARAWRTDATKTADDLIIFYFAGHGIQRVIDEGIILLDDFLEHDHPPLAKSATVGNLRSGLTPSVKFPKVAKTQFFFIDTCLLEPKSLGKFANPQPFDVFGAETYGPPDRRESAVLFSTVNRAAAIGRDGKLSHFAEALISAFDHGAEDAVDPDGNGPVWPITAHTIKTAVNLYYQRAKLGTLVKMDAYVGEPVIRKLIAPPDVDLAILISPDHLQCAIMLMDESDNPVPGLPPFDKTVFDVKIKAGFYKIQITCDRLRANPFRSKLKWINQKASPWGHNLGPSLA
jgi:Caspase domain